MARATGVQISGNRVRVAEIEGSPQKFKIRGAADVLIETGVEVDRGAAIQKALKEAFKVSKANRDHVILGISAADCVLREIMVPFQDPAQIEKIIRFECEPHLHSHTLDEVIVCFHKVAEIGTRSAVLIIAARKDRLAEPLESLEKLGIDPLAIDLDAAGLFALGGTLKDLKERENYLLCEIGADSTTVILVQNRRLRVLRTIRLGTASITSRIGRDLDLNEDQADARARSILAETDNEDEDLFVPIESPSDAPETAKSAPTLERDIVLQREQELVDRMTRELQRTLNGGDHDATPEAILLTGSGSIFPLFQDRLAEAMDMKVESLPLLSHAEHKFGGADVELNNAALPTAVGLALKHLGRDDLGIDFRQEEFRFKKRFDRIKAPLLLLVAMLSVANACWYTFERSMKNHHEGQVIARIAGEARNQFARIVDKVDSKTKQIAKLDDKKLKVMQADVKKRDGRDSIDQVKRNITTMHKELRKLYNLDGAMNRRRSSRGRSTSSSTEAGKKDVSDFSSALLRWEQVFAAIKKTKIKEFAVKSLYATPEKVEFGLTLPELAEIDGKKVTPQDQLNLIEKNLADLGPEGGFVSLTNPGKYTENPEHRGFDFPKISVEFKRERR